MMDHDAMREAIAALALDALDAEERSEIEHEIVEHLPGCDECVALMREVREIAGDLAFAAGAVNPSPALEDKILASIREHDRVAPAPVGRRAGTRVMAAVAAAALVASLGWNAALIGRAERVQREALALEATVRIASDPATKSLALRGPSGGMVLLYQPTGTATLLAAGIDEIPAGKVLELWLIKDGRPVPVVAFRPDRDGAITVNARLSVTGFRGAAVTLEDRFVQAPTSEPLYAGTA